jgi:Pectate lyase superfamily protein
MAPSAAPSAVGATANPSGELLPAERRTVWNPGIQGGVPSRATICATVNASSLGNGTADATPAIQAAIDACPQGQVVFLSAGTFAIASSVRINKGIVLRGAGPAQTLLRMPDGLNQAAVVIGFQWAKTDRSVSLASNAVKGATSVTVASAPGLAAGELVLVDETTDGAITRWSAESAAGDPSRGWFSRMDRPLAQVMEVASVSGNTVSFTTPFHIGFDTAHSAQLSRFVQFVGGPLAAAVKNAGLEDLHVYGGEGGDGGGNVYLELAAYSWVKNVESEYSKGGSVALYSSFRCVVRDSYLHQSKNPNPGGDGYGFSINNGSADNLVENDISWNFNKVIVMRASGGGNVIAYSYFEDAYGAGYPTFVETGLNASHMTTPHFELFEGNEAFNIDADARWGNSVYITYFRNHATGLRRSLGGLRLSDVGNRHAIGAMAGHYWYSFIGNVLGFPGMTPEPAGGSFTYEGVAPWDDNPVPMWKLGYPDSTGTPGVSTDAQVAATAIRDGNFDYATNQVHWDHAAQAIPNSLYLTSKPAFFGSNPWPWVDPTGATKLATLPARARFDAVVASSSSH